MTQTDEMLYLCHVVSGLWV